jgi:hypothetical protein
MSIRSGLVYLTMGLHVTIVIKADAVRFKGKTNYIGFKYVNFHIIFNLYFQITSAIITIIDP